MHHDEVVGIKRSELREGGLRDREMSILEFKENTERAFHDNCSAPLKRFFVNEAMPPRPKSLSKGLLIAWTGLEMTPI